MRRDCETAIEPIRLQAPWAAALTLGLLAAVVAPVRAENLPAGVVRFRAFGSAEGLRNLVVIGITEDSAGFLWVGTDDGLFRYDGERFDQFAFEQGVPSTAVLSVGTDPAGRACAGTNKGLACWNGTRFSQDAALGLPQLAINVIRAHRGQLWVGTADGLYRRANGRFTPAPGWTARGPIKALWTDDHGIVVGTGGRVLLGDGDGAWQEIEPGLAGDRVDSVLRDRTGTLWIRTALHMWRLPRGAARAEDVTAGLPSGYDSVGVAESMIDAGTGELWVSTDVGIARRIDGAWRILDHSGGLRTSSARTLFVDHEGTVWVGAIGLLQLRGRGLIERHDRVNGLPGDVAWSFGRDHEGNLWVGTNRCLAHVVGGKWACLPGTENRIVRSFVSLPQGGVFLGGAPSDLLYIDPRGRPTSIEIAHAPANDHMFLALRLGLEGDLWIGTKAGLFRLAGAAPGVPQRVTIPGIPANARFSSLVIADGRLWSGTSHGLVVLDHGAWHVFDARDGLRSADTRFVARRQDGRLCITYTEAVGVTCFATDGATVSAVQHIGVADGMGSGMAYFVGEDRRGRLWVGTGNGVDVLGANGAGFDHFSEADGLAGDDSAGAAFFEDGDGSLWLGSNGGVTHFDAARYGGPLPPPRVVLREGTLGGHPITDHTATLETSHDANRLSLAFSAYTHADRVEYQVRLRPLDDNFLTTRVSQIRYPTLIANTYELEVRARIGAGPWGPVKQLGFTVRPAWWQSRWFLALAGLGLLGALGGVFHLRQRAVLSRQTRRLHEQSTAELLALLEALPDLITVHRDGKMTYVNDAARRIWCRSPSEMPDIAGRTHPDDQARRNAAYNRVQSASGECSETVELRIRDRDDVYRVFEATYSRLKLAGAPVLVVSGRDVTERKRMREQLLLSDRMASLGTLAAGIAHEINNPLSYVIGNLEILGEGLTAEPGPDGELTTAVRDAADGAERVRKIVAGLRTFSRSEEEQRVALQIGEVLQSAIRLTANEVRHRAQLVCELGPTPRVVADSGRLAQVFINLIVNAAHAIPEGKSGANRITLRTSTDDQGRAVVAVIDTGRGMSPEVLARAFDPFFTTKDVGTGTGLGLAICHGIVSALGGEIGIDSAPGQGTTVWVRLRAAPEDVEREEEQLAPDPGAGERLRVMIVDDDPMVADTIARRLRTDHEVIVVSCGSDALAQIQQGAWFDAIVSDVMMPNMTGIELLEQLLEIAPRQAERVVFLSGGVFAPESRARLDALHAVLLEKPVDMKVLRAAIVAAAASPLTPPSVAALRNLA